MSGSNASKSWGDIFRINFAAGDRVALTHLLSFINGFVPHAAKLPREAKPLEARILGVLAARGVTRDIAKGSYHHYTAGEVVLFLWNVL
eukprot:10263830-Heterocapsa_arctica.AAC.1